MIHKNEGEEMELIHFVKLGEKFMWSITPAIASQDTKSKNFVRSNE